MGGLSDHPELEFRSRAAIRAWLDASHAKETTFWLVTFKKHVAEYYVPYGEIVEELLCYGWVDSRTRRVDDDRTMLLVSPRKPGSTWDDNDEALISKGGGVFSRQAKSIRLSNEARKLLDPGCGEHHPPAGDRSCRGANGPQSGTHQRIRDSVQQPVRSCRAWVCR